MFIENRLKYRNETDSCILRKTCYYYFYKSIGFSVQVMGKSTKVLEQTISSAVGRDTYGGHSKLKTKRSFYLQPKQQLFAKLNAKEVKIPKENEGE